MIKGLIAFLLVFFSFLAVPDAHAEWLQAKGDHFLVFYNKGNDDFAQEVVSNAESYYSSVAEDLGYVRYSNFWTWENRVKIYIYDTHSDYLAASGRPAWSHGMADYNKKQIISYVSGKGFLESILPHEIAHLVFRDFIGFKSDIPPWLDEGVAQWEEKWKRTALKEKIKDNYKKRLMISLADMMRLDIRNMKTQEEGAQGQEENIYIRSTVGEGTDKNIMFMSSSKLVQAYYLQAVSLVGFLIERYGANDFVKFCRSLRDGKSIAEALRSNYPTDIRSIEELEQRWLEYLEELP